MKKRIKIFRFLLSFMFVISTVATGIMPVRAALSSFTDVPDNAYYAESVAWAVDKEITKGTSDTTFSPDDGCTRAQCVTFLYRYAGSPDVDAGKASKFTDVKSGDDYASAVAWAVENEITTGTSNITFSPRDKCTRAQIVTFLWRFKNKPSADYSGVFKDVKSNAYYADAVSWAVAQNITKRTSNTTFGPDQTCTRAQIVTFLYRMDLFSGQAVKSDFEGYDRSHCRLLDIISAEESGTVQTEAEAHTTMENLGLGICPITYQFEMDGNFVGEVEAGDNSSDKHPMYQTLYLSKNEELWNVYLINGNVVAYPVSFNLESDLEAELLVSTSETVTCYGGESNEFYETIPYSSDAVTIIVDTIDSETLDRLTIEELCSMSGASVSVLTEDETDLTEPDSDLPELMEDTSDASVMGDTGAEDPFIVVSLGDSYSSGEGIPEFYGQNLPLTEKVKNENWLAHRSMYSWPSQMKFKGMKEDTLGKYWVDYPNGATSNMDVQWYFAASSGATTEHINLDNQKKGKGKQGKPYYKYTGEDGMNQAMLGLTMIPHIEDNDKKLPNQLDVFDTINNKYGKGTVDCVTLTIGGNDLGFEDVITTAALESSYVMRFPLMRFREKYGDLSKWGKWEEDDYVTSLCYMLSQRIEHLDQYLQKIRQVYKDVRDKAGDQAVILVAGYPELLAKNGKGVAISKDEATLINSSVRLFNERLEDMITNQCGDIGNIYFVDVIDEFNKGSGHQAYSKEEWINPITPGTQSEDLKDFPHSLVSAYSIHPNKTGAEHYATCGNAKIQTCNFSCKITGKVVDFHTGEPIRNNGSYIVKSRNIDGNVEKLNWGTDADGNFEVVVWDNKKGPYSLEISNIWNSYTNELDTVVIDIISLDPIRPTDIGTIELYKGTDIGGGTVDLGKANVGDYVSFGHYEQDNNTANGQEAIEWKVLDKVDGRVLLFSKYGLDSKPYNEVFTDVNWETCTLRNWLNNSFLEEAFSTSERSAIPTVFLSNPDYPIYRTKGGNNTQDQVFLLSLQEMQRYFNLSDTWTDFDGNNYDITESRHYLDLGGSKDVITSPTDYANAQGAFIIPQHHDSEGELSCWWWLRSPGHDDDCAPYVNRDGYVDVGGLCVNYDYIAVRPALWVNLAS